MNNVVEVYKARKKLQEDGIWVDMLVGKVKIKHMRGNAPLVEKVQGLGEKLKQGSEEEMFAQLADILAEHVVLDWEGFGVDYSPETFLSICEELGSDSGFVQDIAGFCMDLKLLDEAAIATAAKN